MKTQHTPGPWRFVADGEMDDDCNVPRIPVPFDFSGPGYHNNPSIESFAGVEIVGCNEYLVFGPTFRKEERAANVALMCAAPDLLKALERVVWIATAGEDRQGVYYEPVGGDWHRIVEAARAAIAKATQAP